MFGVARGILQIFADHGLVERRMVLLFLPSMATFAARLLRTPFMILCNESARLPILADLVSTIVENIRFPSKVLPVVSIHALRFVVLLIEGTPLCLEVEHVEVGILGHLVDQPCLQLLSTMRKRAIVTVFAL